MVRVPFRPIQIRLLRSLHRLTSTWPEPSSVAHAEAALSLARGEPSSVVHMGEALSSAGAEPPSVVRMGALWLAGAITEALGMAPEGVTGTAVGGPTG
jgi:hypothetical protein